MSSTALPIKLESLKDFRDELPDDRHSGYASNQDHFIELDWIQLGVIERAQTVRTRTPDNRPSDRFQLLARQVV